MIKQNKRKETEDYGRKRDGFTVICKMLQLKFN